jgi:putative transposase
MARLARVVIPGIPHHVTQGATVAARSSSATRIMYRDWLGDACRANGVEIWTWVLMPNHVHLILVPSDVDGIRRALAPVHRRYAGHVHARLKRTGHFWQGRFGCVAMDEAHLGAAFRYIVLNPVRARLVDKASEWPWSSVHVHLGPVGSDGVTTPAPCLARYSDFAALLEAGEDDERIKRLRKAETIGRPIGDRSFLDHVGQLCGRRLEPRKRGPKPQLSALSP